VQSTTPQPTTPCPTTSSPRPDHIRVGDLPLSVGPCTPEELGQQAVQLVPIAQRVVGTVHLDGPAAIRELLHPLDAQQLSALVVVLAAMVDLEASPSQLLAWVNWDDPASWPEPIQAATPTRGRRPTRQQLKERRDQVVALTRAGMAASDIAARLGIKPQVVRRDRTARGLTGQGTGQDQPANDAANDPVAGQLAPRAATPAAPEPGESDRDQDRDQRQVGERGCAA
jgi:hypothetical protein